MTDLTYCYLHMNRHDILILDTVMTEDYYDEDLEVHADIPAHLVPPNPEATDSELPTAIHPSYPYGNPTNIKHPSTKPRPPYDPTSRALFADMGYAGGGVNGTLRWRDLALDDLLPVDESMEEELAAIQARKMASGASNHNPQAHQQAHVPQAQQTEDEEEEEDEDDEEENDENINEEYDEEEEGEDEEEEESEGDEE